MIHIDTHIQVENKWWLLQQEGGRDVFCSYKNGVAGTNSAQLSCGYFVLCLFQFGRFFSLQVKSLKLTKASSAAGFFYFEAVLLS